MADFFEHEGFKLAFMDEGEGDPVLLVHGFASNFKVNWVSPGWVKTLREAGYRVVAFDHRGHGGSSGSLVAADYHPLRMAADAVALLDHLDIPVAHWFGYSMGARVSAFAAIETPQRMGALVLGGLGMGLVKGVGEWDIIAAALRAPDPADVTHPRGKMFRSFADRTHSDRMALAAGIEGSRAELSVEEVGRIDKPTLIGVGTKDDLAGSPEGLAAMIKGAEAFEIAGRDHMLAVGDRSFKAKVVDFLKAHPLQV